MEFFDAAVIGGGLVGCFAARALARYDMKTVLIDAAEDVCTGISKANTAIVYSGCDNRTGSLKAKLTVRANAGFSRLCDELSVPFRRCGSLMTGEGPNSGAVLKKKLRNAEITGVPGARIISAPEAREIEPALGDGFSSALYLPTTGTVNPWLLCYAAYENAVRNGCNVRLNTELLTIRRSGKSYILETGRGEIAVKAVVNCAGLRADRVHEMLFEPSVRIFPDSGDYIVFRRGCAGLSHIIQREPEDGGKGTNIVPTTDGSILAGPTERPVSEMPDATSRDGLESIASTVPQLIPGLNASEIIRSFAAVRPNPFRIVFKNGKYIPDGSSTNSFVIERPEAGFISFIGIKTPGLTCAEELGKLAAEAVSSYLGIRRRNDFDPHQDASPCLRNMSLNQRVELTQTDIKYANIICLCEQISEGEIIDAISRGAVTIDGIKRRCGAILGECQGSRCRYEIARILSRELSLPAASFLGEAGEFYVQN